MYNYIYYIKCKLSSFFNYISDNFYKCNKHKKTDDTENYDNDMCYDLIFNNSENKNEYFINMLDL